jgi:hypothetical protein
VLATASKGRNCHTLDASITLQPLDRQRAIAAARAD